LATITAGQGRRVAPRPSDVGRERILSQEHYPFALPIGTVISGYEIVRVLGVGGFGITYEGFNPVTRRRAAIKEFFPRGIASRENATQVVFSRHDNDVVSWALDRFRRSTTELCEFKHPNIVDVLNYVPANETGYMFMEQVEGETLEQWLRRKGAELTFAELREMLMPICDALEYVHTRKFIHRDIAPDNIMIRKDGRPMLIDFGAIKIIAQTAQTRAASGRSYGVAKQHYSPPEQMDDDAQLDPRADVYALGAVIYRAVAGHPPVDADKRKNDLILKGADSYVSVALATKIPLSESVIHNIDRALSIKPADRPSSIAEFRAGLQESGAATKIQEPATKTVKPQPMPTPGFSGPGSGAPTAFANPAQAAAQPHVAAEQAPRKSNTWIGIAAIAAVVLIIGGVFAVSSFRGTDVVTPTPTPTPTPTTGTARAQIDRGDTLFKDKRYDEAVAAYTEAIRLDPANAEAYRKRGEAWAARPETKGDLYKRAEDDFATALRLVGNNTGERVAVLRARAKVHGSQSRYGEQISDLTEALRYQPNNTGILKERGTGYWYANRYDEALADHTKAIQLEPKNWEHYADRGRTNKWKKDYIAAVADFSDAIRLNPSFNYLYSRRGEVYALRGDFDRALMDYAEAIRRAPDNLLQLRERADIYVMRADKNPAKRTDDLNRARADLDKVLLESKPQNGGDYEKRGLVLEKLGKRAEAIADFRAALSRDSSLSVSRQALQRLGG
jgi:serine/threonine protein kinase/Flp pilus assembly protein TadD